MKTVIIFSVGMVLWVYYTCDKMHKIVHFKYVLFILFCVKYISTKLLKLFLSKKKKKQ